MNSPNRRIALYSHDTQGLGHLRRNLSIATALIEVEPNSVILMIAGVREANAFTMPPGVDCLTLPAIEKSDDGQYHPRSLGVSLRGLIEMRSNIIRSALESFEPDVLIVDKVPLGVFGELRLSLELLQAQGYTHCVLGLREVLDDPKTTRHEWHLGEYSNAIRAYYDAVWVYGDPRVYDPVHEYGLPCDITAKVRYTGYLDRRIASNPTRDDKVGPLANFELPPGQLALCMVGGGRDGYHLANTFLQTKLRPDTNGLVLTGPFMPLEARQNLYKQAAVHPRQQVLEFTDQPESLLSRADHVVAMGGYNTICEILSYEKRALIVPRVKPRREQLIRAEYLRDLGLLNVLHPADLEPQVLTAWLARDTGPPVGIRERVDLGGLTRLPGLLNEVLTFSGHPPGFRQNQRHPNLSHLAGRRCLFGNILAAPSSSKEVKCVNY